MTRHLAVAFVCLFLHRGMLKGQTQPAFHPVVVTGGKVITTVNLAPYRASCPTCPAVPDAIMVGLSTTDPARPEYEYALTASLVSLNSGRIYQIGRLQFWRIFNVSTSIYAGHFAYNGGGSGFPMPKDPDFFGPQSPDRFQVILENVGAPFWLNREVLDAGVINLDANNARHWIPGVTETARITPSAPPRFVSLTPGASALGTEVFSFKFRDEQGAYDIETLYVNLNLVQSPQNSCYIEIKGPPLNKIRLMNDAGTEWSYSLAAGTNAGVLSNSQCDVHGTSVVVATPDGELSTSLVVSAKPSYTGRKNVFLKALDLSDNSSEWLAYGSWYPNMTGARVNRYRLYNPFSNSHLHTTDLNEYNVLGTWGFTQEGVSGQVYDAPTTVEGVDAVPMYRLYYIPGRRHFWTTDRNEYLTLAGLRGIYVAESADGFVMPRSTPGSVPLFRLLYCCAYPYIHHWTTDANEYSVLAGLGWQQEGIAAHVFAAPPAIRASEHSVSGAAPERPRIHTVANAASLKTMPLAPGQVVRIAGQGLVVPPHLTSVALNGKELRMLSSSPEAIVALIPEDLAPESQAMLEVRVGKRVSEPVALATAPSSPGIFTEETYLAGTATSTIQDDIVTVFITGRGIVDLPTKAWINGRPASIISVTPAEDTPGVVSVSMRIPAGVKGDAATVTLKIGEASTQPGVVVRLR